MLTVIMLFCVFSFTGCGEATCTAVCAVSQAAGKQPVLHYDHSHACRSCKPNPVCVCILGFSVYITLSNKNEM
jgi:hypothetical protein